MNFVHKSVNTTRLRAHTWTSGGSW